MNYTPGDGGVTVRSGPKLLDQVRNRLRVLHYSLCTEQAYLSWIRRFILASGKHYLRSWAKWRSKRFSPAWRSRQRRLQAHRTRRWRRCCFSPATYCVSIGITCPTKSLVFKILSRGVTVHNRAVTTPNARNEKTAQCAVFRHTFAHPSRTARQRLHVLALGSRSCLVTANGPMLSIGTATITDEITTITAPIMCVSARPSIDSPP